MRSSTVEGSLAMAVPAAVVAGMLIAVVDASIAGAVEEIDHLAQDCPVDEDGLAEDSDAGALGSHQHKQMVQDSHTLTAHKIVDDEAVEPWTLRVRTHSHALL